LRDNGFVAIQTFTSPTTFRELTIWTRTLGEVNGVKKPKRTTAPKKALPKRRAGATAYL